MKHIFTLAAVLSLATPVAWAAGAYSPPAVPAPKTPPASAPPAPSADPNKVTLTLDPQELVIIANALADQPFKVSAPVIQDVQRQFQQWQMLHQAPVPPMAGPHP
jgi:hypothetical protein